MGAINYFTSDYITIGLKPYDTIDLENDSEFMEELQNEINEYGGTLENALNDYISICYESDYSNIEYALKKYSFYYYHVTIEPGYYEGFTIKIENNFPIAFDNYEDKKEANKEITQLKLFLIECARLGLVECFPGWCTGYSDYKNTIKAINIAAQAMREEVKTIPTWNQYNKGA